jgi:hypothetical protein
LKIEIKKAGIGVACPIVFVSNTNDFDNDLILKEAWKNIGRSKTRYKIMNALCSFKTSQLKGTIIQLDR